MGEPGRQDSLPFSVWLFDQMINDRSSADAVGASNKRDFAGRRAMAKGVAHGGQQTEGRVRKMKMKIDRLMDFLTLYNHPSCADLAICGMCCCTLTNTHTGAAQKSKAGLFAEIASNGPPVNHLEWWPSADPRAA